MTTWRSLLQKTKTYELSKSLSTGESYTVAVDQEPIKPLEVWLGNTYYGNLADDLTVTPTAPHETLTIVSFYNPVIQTVMLNSGTIPTSYTRAPEDIEADIQAVRLEAANALDDYAQTVTAQMEDLQGQVDGSITQWFYPVPPVNNAPPSSEWTDTDTKNSHLGDLYYDTETGYVYRWQLKQSAYSWQRIADTDVTKALEDAAKAQDTADGKRRVFWETPTPPYDQGDLWTQGTSGDLMRATFSRQTGTYQAADWVKAVKYTDDTKANEANQRSQTNEVAINDMGLTVTQHTTDIKGLQTTTSTHQTAITAHGTSISTISNDLNTITRQHHGLPPPTTYKTGDRWALKAYTNADLSGYTNAQLQSWGIRNAILSGGELLATRGRTGTYNASDWTWIATSGTELSRIDQLLTDVQAGRIQLSSLTQLPGGGWQIGNFAVHDYDRSRWQHADGSYTQIGSSPGLEQYIAGRGHRYHNLMYVANLSGSDTLTKWVQLPDEFKGKPFEVYVAISDSAEHVEAGGDAALDNRSAIRRLVATLSPEAEIDYAEARVPYKIYKLSVDIHNVINEPLEAPWRVTRAVGIMIAIA